MAKYLIKDTTLTNIANAIRAKTGKANSLTPEEMPDEISSITSSTVTEMLLKPSEYPDYVRAEINRVADEVRKVLTNESIVSLCLSDSHYPADTNTKTGVLHAMMAIKGLTYLLPVDFIAHMGDVGYEGDSKVETDTATLEANLLEILNYIKESGGNSIPLFVAIGNHDSGPYITKDNDSDLLSGRYLYNNFTALSASANTVFSGEDNGGYCYRDFPDKKLRVFLLNTSEEIVTGGYDNDNGTSVIQRAWIASKLQELNTKSDANQWGIIVLCHYPLDYGSSKTLSNVFEAYVNGTSITLNGTVYNFSGKNAARFLVQFHGHIHNFLVDKLYGGALSNRLNGIPTAQYDAYRVAIPNAQYNRENYYYYTDANGNTVDSSDGTMWGIKFFEGTYSQKGEDKAYHKTIGTAKDTSFVVNVINPSEDKIYSFVYGAGYNRVVGIGRIVYYSVTKSLTNVTLSNESASSVEHGTTYTATISVEDKYAMDSIKITMGGTDITMSVYTDGVINIPSVTGDIVISATASRIPTTNLRMIAYDFVPNTTTIYNNGLGYKNNCRTSGNITSNGSEWETTDSTANGYVMTGCIAWDKVSSINISGAEIVEGDGKIRMNFLDTPGGSIYSPWLNNADITKKVTWYDYFDIVETSRYNYKLTKKSTWTPRAEIKYFFMTLKGTGEDLMITFGDNTGEAEQYYTITNTLVNVTTNNSASSITPSSNYTATLTAKNGHVLSDVKVVMGGVDVTSNVYSNGNIVITNVTGNIVITATAKSTSGYTNQIPLSTTTLGGTEIFNAPYGFEVGKRVGSSGGEPVDSKPANTMCCTGFINLPNPAKGKTYTVRIKNVTVPTTGYDAEYLLLLNENGTPSGETIGEDRLLAAMDANGVITLTIGGYTNVAIHAIRLSVSKIDETSIITIDEEIS